MQFSFLGILKTFSFFLRPVLQLCGQREHMMTDVNFCLLMSQALVQQILTKIYLVIFNVVLKNKSNVF